MPTPATTPPKSSRRADALESYTAAWCKPTTNPEDFLSNFSTAKRGGGYCPIITRDVMGTIDVTIDVFASAANADCTLISSWMEPDGIGLGTPHVWTMSTDATPSTSANAQVLEVSSPLSGPYTHLECSGNAVVGYLVESEVACLSNANCTGGKICDGGSCVTPGCTSDASCGAYKCVNGACQTRCSSNSQCSSGNSCTVMVASPNFTCKPTCDDDGDCGLYECITASGVCATSCVNTPPNDRCSAGNRCSGSTCIAGCNTNANCPSGKVCSPTTHQCVQCLNDSACGFYTCNTLSGTCNTGCTTEAQCANCPEMRCEESTCLAPYLEPYCSAGECRRGDMCADAAHCNEGLQCEWDTEDCDSSDDEPCGD